MSPDLVSLIVRALAFVALFQAAGVALFLAGFGRHLTASQSGIRRLGLVAAAAGIVLVLAHLSLDPARMAGDFSGMWDATLQRLAWNSSSGLSSMAQVLGLLVILTALSLGAEQAPGPQVAAVIGVVVAIGAFLLTGHTSAHPLRALLAPLLALHLLIVAFWFGALLPLVLISRIETTAVAGQVLRRFSAFAGPLVPLIAVAGVAMAAILCGSLGVVHRPYGQLLLLKLAGFVVLLGLAAYNRWRLMPALPPGTATAGAAAAPGPRAAGAAGATANTVHAAAALRRSMSAEYLLIVAVLCATDVLTTLFSPH
ncbi:MAG TPA: CopD family protein [Steroidobacteraceae bacterium]|jgi:putative copper export protein|nr:CopD family protein [Steroidobacteraceae bacterium]